MKKKKKDPNLVAKLEQAIEKKYGEEAVAHPRGNWNDEKEKEYLQQIKEFSEKQKAKKETKTRNRSTFHRFFMFLRLHLVRKRSQNGPNTIPKTIPKLSQTFPPNYTKTDPK